MSTSRLDSYSISIAAAALALMVGPPARASVVQVEVTGVTEARGHVRVDLCTRATFLSDSCPYHGDAPATVGSTEVTIADVAPGVYAAQAFDDVSDAGVVHQNLLGIPREKIGFSNDARVRLHGPSFKDAAFEVGDEVRRVSFALRRLFHSGD